MLIRIATGTALALGALVVSATPAHAEETSTVPCHAVWDKLPDELQADVEAIADLPADEQRAAVRELRHDAVAGAYGPKIAWLAGHRTRIRAAAWRHLPVVLRQDLGQARRIVDVDDRRAAYEKIASDALAGAYGQAVQQAASKIQVRREICGPLGI